MALQAAGGMAGAGAGGLVAAGLGNQLGMPNRMNFRPPGGPSGAASAASQVKAPGGSAVEHTIADKHANVPDRSCLAVELDGDKFSAAFADEKGVQSKLLTDSKEGPLMPAAVSIPSERSGLIVSYMDRMGSDERGKGLPAGITVGGAALAEPGLVAGVIKRMIGRSSKEAGVVKHARRCAVTLRSRKAHEARRRHSILGYDSDDEVDETDGGFRVYEGSRLSLEVKSNTREGKMHILPEELLALCLVELRGRAIKAREQSADPVPRAVTMVTPACWGDAQRSAAATAAGLVGVDVRLMTPSLAAAAGALVGGGRAAVLSETIHGGGGGGKNGGGGKTLAATVRDSMDAEVVGLAEPIFASNLLVLTAGFDGLEAAVVRVQGSPLESQKSSEGAKESAKQKKKKKKTTTEKKARAADGDADGGGDDDNEEEEDKDEEDEDEGEKEVRLPTAFDWVESLDVLAARGEAYERAGLGDLAESAAGAADDVGALRDYAERVASSYGSSGPSQTTSKKGLPKGAEEGAQAILECLLGLIDAALAAAKKKWAAGADGGFSAVLVRGAMLGVPLALFQQPLSAALAAKVSQAAGSSASGGALGLWTLPVDAAVRGAVAIAAAKRALPRSAFAHEMAASDALQRSFAIAHTAPSVTKSAEETASGLPEWSWKADPAADEAVRLDELFPRDCCLPATVERVYDKDALRRLRAGGFMGKGLKLTVTEQNPSNESDFLRALPLGNPMERGSLAEGTLQRSVTSTLRFTVDDSGLLKIETVKFVTGKEAQAESDKKSSFVVRNAGRIVMALFLILCTGGIAWMILSDMWEQSNLDAKRFSARKAALIEFYEQHNPEKIGSIDDALNAHYGQESKLWRKLEKKYGIRPPRPNFLQHGLSKGQTTRRSEL